ncbi:hypothetical protein M405DRAFT_843885 [Rhizopogon salebrosus TDB-379]|nr:hypothetical protein M405DRAFT_843885 [Rhizopogon salebrosus TDB-379]
MVEAAQRIITITTPNRNHELSVTAVAVFPDGRRMVTGSQDKTLSLWRSAGGRFMGQDGKDVEYKNMADVNCVRFSSSGELLAIVTNIHIQIRNPRTSECIAKFKAATMAALVPIPPYESEIHPHGSRLEILILGVVMYTINTITVNSTGTLAASSTSDKHSGQYPRSLWWEEVSENSTRERSLTVSRLAVVGTTPQADQKSVTHQRQFQPPSNVTEREISYKAREWKERGYRPTEGSTSPCAEAQRYDEAIKAFQIMLYKLDNTSDAQARKLRQQYLSPSDAKRIIRKIIHAQMENAPPRLLDTATGLLCDRNAQIDTFTTSIQYEELLLFTITHADLRLERIKRLVGVYFRRAMLSHSWEGKVPLLLDIRDKAVYELNEYLARDAGYRWAWMDTCCIDQTNNVEVQELVNSMSVWFRHSALTIIYLSDVPPSSKSGALAKRAWNSRGWSVQEFLALKVVLFYQLASAAFSPMSHFKAVIAVFMERTPFAIDDAGNDDDDSDLDMVHGEDDDRVMDEVDAFLEAHDSGLSEADKKVANGKI